MKRGRRESDLMQRQRGRQQRTPIANAPFWSTAATTKQDMEHRKEQNFEGECAVHPHTVAHRLLRALCSARRPKNQRGA